MEHEAGDDRPHGDGDAQDADERSVYDVVVLRLGPRCPPLDDLRKLGPLVIEGGYVAFLAAAVTPELAAALDPERARHATSAR